MAANFSTASGDCSNANLGALLTLTGVGSRWHSKQQERRHRQRSGADHGTNPAKGRPGQIPKVDVGAVVAMVKGRQVDQDQVLAARSE